MRARIVAAALLAACFDPTYPQHLACSTTFTCPPGQACSSAGTCEPAAESDAAPDVRLLPDAHVDASPTGPVAYAGADQQVTVGGTVNLGSSGSYDPLSRPLFYHWTLVSRPADSAVVLDIQSAAAAFVPDVEGDYIVNLEVSAGGEVGDDQVLIRALPVPLTVSVSPDFATYTGTPVAVTSQVTGTHGALTYAWRIADRPPGSVATLAGADAPAAQLTPDIDGDYVVALVVTDRLTHYPAQVQITSYHPIARLAHGVVDAEISRPLDRIVMVAASPAALYLYDPTGGSETKISLPLAATSVSVGPDGSLAAVGHDAYVSIVDLAAARVVKTCPVSVDVYDVALAGNGYVYVLPNDTMWTELHSVEIASCAETSTGSSYNEIYGTGGVKLHPDGDRLYATDYGISSEALFDIDITGGTAVVAATTPPYDMYKGGKLWITEDGGRIVTRRGNTFRATKQAATDMTYAGALPSSLNGIGFADHTTKSGKIVVVPSDYVQGYGDPPADMVVRVHDAAFLVLEKEVALPKFVFGGKVFDGHGKFVFLDAGGAHYHVLLQADASAQLANDFAVASFAL